MAEPLHASLKKYYLLKRFSILLFFFLFLNGVFIQAQTTIWEEDFSYPDGTFSGQGSPATTSWIADGTSNNRGVSVYNTQLRGYFTQYADLTTWEISSADPIEINSYENVSVTIDLSETSTLEDDDYIQIQYNVDGAGWINFPTNGLIYDDFGSAAAEVTGLSGSSLQLRIIMTNNAEWFLFFYYDFEEYLIDNIVVKGTLPSVPPECASFTEPTDEETDVPVNSEISWEPVELSNGYYFYFGTDYPPTNIENGTTVTSTFYDPPADLSPNTAYYWKVVPYNNAGPAADCPIWSFTTGNESVIDTAIRIPFNEGQDIVFNFPFGGCKVISDGILSVTIQGDINESGQNEFYYIESEAGQIAQFGPTNSGPNNDCDIASEIYTIDVSDMQNFSSDGTMTFIADPQSGVDELCDDPEESFVEMSLRYSYATIPECNILASSQVCSGEQDMLITGPDLMYSYEWDITRGDAVINGDSGNQTVSVDAGISNFTISLTVESYPGCSSVCDKTISVNPAPSAPAISTITQPDCDTPTGSVLLTGLPSPGTWTLTQTPGGTTTTGTGTSTTISGLTDGTYNYSATYQADGAGLTADYYNNKTLTGTPALTKTDATVDFNWGNGGPGGPIGNDNFSVRWIGKVLPLYTETYTFSTRSDDGVRLWVDGTQIIDNWTDHASTVNNGTIALTAGQAYDIVLEFYENGGQAVIELSWSSASQSAEIIPQTQLYPVETLVTDCPSPPSNDIIINPQPEATSITMQPSSADQYLCQDDTPVALSVTASGTNLYYQWYSNITQTNSGGTLIDGALNASCTPSTSTAGTLYYYCSVTGDCGTATSDVSGAITVYGTTITSGDIGGDPEYTYCEGRNPLSFSVGAPSGGDGNYTYQWQQSEDCLGTWTDAVAQDGITNTLSFNPPELNVTTCYRLRITDGCGSEAFSGIKTYNIVPQPVAPEINPVPSAGTSVCAGETVSATFEPGSGGAGTVTDVYEYSTDGGSNWNSYIPGENVTTATGMEGTDMIQIRTRRLASETGCQDSEWNYVSWTVDEIPNNSSNGFSGNTICEGENGVLNFNAINSSFIPTYTIEYTDGITTWSQIITDDADFSFNVAVNPVETTNYSLVSITNGNGCARTTGFGDETARIVVNELPTATISGDATVCEGESATITVDLTGTPDWNLTFQLDGANYLTVENIPSSPYTFNVSQAGEYTVSAVSDAHCVGTASGSATVTVTGFNMIVSDVTSVASGNHCPEFGGPFNANTASYNPGVTEVVFKVEKGLSASSDWTFDFEVDETGEVEVYDLTLGGNNSAITYSGDDAGGSIDAADNTEVTFTFQIWNVPGASLDVEFVVSNGNDGVCTETGSTDDNWITHIINVMPAVGSFSP